MKDWDAKLQVYGQAARMAELPRKMGDSMSDQSRVEWEELIETARRMGLSIQEIREFLASGQKKDGSKPVPACK